LIKKAPRGAASSGPSDGLNEEVWRRLSEVITVAHRGDGNAFLKLLKRFDVGWSDSARDEASSYLFYLVKYRVVEILARRPMAADLHEVAVMNYDSYAKVVREPVATLEDTLRAVFALPSVGPQQSSARLFVSSVAAAGVLFKEPPADLDAIRPHLAKWSARST
jgi:hypothetical protein